WRRGVFLPRLRRRRPGGARAGRIVPKAVRAHLALLARVGLEAPLPRPDARGGRAQRAGARAPRLRALGSGGGGPHHLPPRARRRRSQLGLPLLLAARRLSDRARSLRTGLR